MVSSTSRRTTGPQAAPGFEAMDDLLTMPFDAMRNHLTTTQNSAPALQGAPRLARPTLQTQGHAARGGGGGGGGGYTGHAPIWMQDSVRSTAPPPPPTASRSQRGLTPPTTASVRSHELDPHGWSYEELLALDENNVKRGIPASQRNRVMRACNASGECPVCREAMTTASETVELTCKHRFHKACIEPWFQENRTCPVCRVELVK